MNGMADAPRGVFSKETFDESLPTWRRPSTWLATSRATPALCRLCLYAGNLNRRGVSLQEYTAAAGLCMVCLTRRRSHRSYLRRCKSCGDRRYCGITILVLWKICRTAVLSSQLRSSFRNSGLVGARVVKSRWVWWVEKITVQQTNCTKRFLMEPAVAEQVGDVVYGVFNLSHPVLRTLGT